MYLWLDVISFQHYTGAIPAAAGELLAACIVICGVLWAGVGRQASAPGQSPDVTDEELMKRFATGDAEAFNVLMERYQRRVYAFIYRNVYNKDKAAELFQDSFYKVIRAAKTFNPNQKFSTWLFTVVRNTLIDYYKKKKLRTVSLSAPLRPGEEKGTLADVIPDPRGADGERYAAQRQLEERLESALETLNPDQKEVFMMRQFQGLPFAEIAEITGCPVNTAKTRMRYALEALRRELADFA